MSVTLMSNVFHALIDDLKYTDRTSEKPRTAKASTVKLVLLAYADHANDDGFGTYPGYTLLERKTALSRQGISDTLTALKQNQFMTLKGVSVRGTNEYNINVPLIQSLVKPLDQYESSHLTSTSQATRLNPSLTTLKPSEEDDAILKNDGDYKLLLEEYEKFHGTISTSEMHMLGDLLDHWRTSKSCKNTNRQPWLVIMTAVRITAEKAHNRRSMAYTRRVIDAWIEHGYGWQPEKYPNGKKYPGKSIQQQIAEA